MRRSGSRDPSSAIAFFDGIFSRSDRRCICCVLKAAQEAGPFLTFRAYLGPPWTVVRKVGRHGRPIAIARLGSPVYFAGDTVDDVTTRVANWVVAQTQSPTGSAKGHDVGHSALPISVRTTSW